MLRLWIDECPVRVALRLGKETGVSPCAAETALPKGSAYRSLDLAGPLYLGALPAGKPSRLRPNGLQASQ